MVVEIIKAAMSHLDAVYNLICELEGEALDKYDFMRIYQENIDDRNVHYVLAADRSGVIGFASLHIQKLLHHCAKTGEIQEIIISEKYQGAGAGTELFDYLVKTAVSSGCTHLEVCTRKVREKTHEFYLKQGMKQSHYKFVLDLVNK